MTDTTMIEMAAVIARLALRNEAMEAEHDRQARRIRAMEADADDCARRVESLTRERDALLKSPRATTWRQTAPLDEAAEYPADGTRWLVTTHDGRVDIATAPFDDAVVAFAPLPAAYIELPF